jgi:hypothetical protein
MVNAVDDLHCWFTHHDAGFSEHLVPAIQSVMQTRILARVFLNSAVDPDPDGSKTFCLIRIRNEFEEKKFSTECTI